MLHLAVLMLKFGSLDLTIYISNLRTNRISMSKVCQLSGKKKSTGFNVSHSNRHTKRTFSPNVTKSTIIDPVTGTKLKIKISTRAKRTLLKNPGKYKLELASLVKRHHKKMAKSMKVTASSKMIVAK